MPLRQSICLSGVQETLLVPLYARAVESRRRHPILEDRKAVEMVESIDWDFQRFNQKWRMAACILRTAMFDEMVKDFLRCHPQGTVVEIGTGLNTRFERLDNGTVHWFDLDLPDAIELRRKFFSDDGRRVMLAGSILDSGWMAAVRQSPGPYFFVAEAVFVYLREPEVKAALAQIVDNFPNAGFAFDTAGRRAVEHGNKDHARQGITARFEWACDDPGEIERWNVGLRLVESRSPADIAGPLQSRLPFTMRTTFRLVRKYRPNLMKLYLLSVFAGR